MSSPKNGFHFADYIVFALTILISIAIGVYHAYKGRKATTADFLVGNRKMRLVPTAISMIVSFESSIMILGFPAEVYTHGASFLWFGLFCCLGFCFTARIAPKFLHGLKITTIFQYLKLSLNSEAVRVTSSVLALMYHVLYMGIVIFGPAIALQAVTDFPFIWSVISVAGASILYTSTGGFRAVIWTDIFQAFVMLVGTVATIVKGTIDVGGPAEVIRYAREGGRLDMTSFDINPTIRMTFWSLAVGATFSGMCFILNQTSIQRIVASSNKQIAVRSVLLAAPLYVISSSLPAIQGLIVFAYYSKIRCDPFANSEITNPNQILPLFVMNVFSSLPGMPGLFMASLYSASLSTLSSSLSAISAIIVDDYAIPIRPNLSDRLRLITGKVTVVVSGIIGVCIAFLISNVPGPLTQIVISLISVVAGPLTGLILLTMIVPFLNYKGAMAGVGVSFSLTCWISLGSLFSTTIIKEPPLPPTYVDNCTIINVNTSTLYNYTIRAIAQVEQYENYRPQGLDIMYSLTFLLFNCMAIIVTIIVGCVVSAMTGSVKPQDVDGRYKIPFFDLLCCCLPEKILHRLRCGVDYSQANVNGLTENKKFNKYPDVTDGSEMNMIDSTS